jgi:hypothetical protein
MLSAFQTKEDGELKAGIGLVPRWTGWQALLAGTFPASRWLPSTTACDWPGISQHGQARLPLGVFILRDLSSRWLLR